MPISKQGEKLDVIKKLQAIRDKLDRLFLPLTFGGHADEAVKVEAKSQELGDQISDLLGQVIDEWVGSAQSVVDKLRKANDKLQANVREIEKDTDTAKNVVKLLGHVDDVIAIAAKVAGAAV